MLDDVRLRLRMELAARSSRPILVGPWRSEVGFEVLYWLPFLEQLWRQYAIGRERLVILTRGGAALWYQVPSSHAIDLYDLCSVEECRVQTNLASIEQQSVKQLRITAWDRAVIDSAKQRLGVEDAFELHPSVMYRALAPWWEDRASVGWLGRRTRFTRLPIGTLPEGLVLPREFVAVRFYARYTFLPEPAVMAWAQHRVLALAAETPVVLLDMDLHTDEHLDFPMPAHPNIVRLDGCWTASTNLAVQSAVLARARRFVGTYGGLAQLALRLGVPSESYYTQWGGTCLAHLALSQRLSVMTGVEFRVGRPIEPSA